MHTRTHVHGLYVFYTLRREAFYTEEQASTGRKKWLQALMFSINKHTLKCTASTGQINGYLMKKYELFYDSDNPPTRKIAVKGTGLQETHKIWVLNADVQYDDDGDLLDVDSSPYIWLGRFAETLQMPSLQASSALPRKKIKAGQKLIQSLEDCYLHNFPACLLLLGAEVLCLHYETLMETVGQVPVTVVFGHVGQGKSKATRAALSLLGVERCNYFQELTDHRALKLTSTTTLGVVIDDPTDHRMIAEKIMQHFERGMHGSAHATFTPRTTFMTSMNGKCLKQLAREPRCVSHE